MAHLCTLLVTTNVPTLAFQHNFAVFDAFTRAIPQLTRENKTDANGFPLSFVFVCCQNMCSWRFPNYDLVVIIYRWVGGHVLAGWCVRWCHVHCALWFLFGAFWGATVNVAKWMCNLVFETLWYAIACLCRSCAFGSRTFCSRNAGGNKHVAHSVGNISTCVGSQWHHEQIATKMELEIQKAIAFTWVETNCGNETNDGCAHGLAKRRCTTQTLAWNGGWWNSCKTKGTS